MPDGLADASRSLRNPEERSYWTVFRKSQRGCSPESAQGGIKDSLARAHRLRHKESSGPQQTMEEEQVPVFAECSLNQPWTKNRSDQQLCRFLLKVTRRPPTVRKSFYQSLPGPRGMEANAFAQSPAGAPTRLHATPRPFHHLVSPDLGSAPSTGAAQKPSTQEGPLERLSMSTKLKWPPPQGPGILRNHRALFSKADEGPRPLHSWLSRGWREFRAPPIIARSPFISWGRWDNHAKCRCIRTKKH